jgi:2-C-methyl-D-erythritol 4-phosphate cytidylyltransferase/2-C-methyl-D-erythritol 2,4-cyclodiphosphate synthase
MPEKPSIYALIVAAGSGTRAGGAVPKQYAAVAGMPMLRHSAEALLAHPQVAGVQVVINPEHRAQYDAATLGLPLPEPVPGGAARADSVCAGLAALAGKNPDYVLVHDAARPFLSRAVLNRLLAALAPTLGVVPALPVADTVRRFDRGDWQEIPRDGLLRIQTPQAFPFDTLYGIARLAAAPATDEAALWLAAGKKLLYVEGEERLNKITSAAELETAMGNRRTAIGMGYDVHELMPAGQAHRIRLGGIDIPHDHKLHGHSDADVVLHAIVDALLGALAEGDIGMHFPPSDPQWKGADSAKFIDYTREKVAARGGVIEHVDVTVICEHPKIGPHREAMRAHIAELLQLPLPRISVKATTTEKLGFTGREEGVAAQAIATVTLPEAA